MIRPRNARNPYNSDPFRGASSDVAKILETWRNSTFESREKSGNSGIAGIPEIPEKSLGGESVARLTGSRPRKTRMFKLLLAEIGPGQLPIATPQIRPPGARNPQTSDPFWGANSDVAKSWKFGGIPEFRKFPTNL